MYCSRCGTQNDDASRFCRSCGLDLQAVAESVAGMKMSFAAEGLELRGDESGDTIDGLLVIAWRLDLDQLANRFDDLVFTIRKITQAIHARVPARSYCFFCFLLGHSFLSSAP